MATKKSPGRIVAYGLVIITGLYVLCLIGLTLFQRKLMYFPCKANLRELEPVAAKSGFQPWRNQKGEFIGWFRSCQSGAPKRALLLFHGNAGCAPDWFGHADALQATDSVDVYILEFPGYGGRSGSPSESSLLKAGEEGLLSITNQCRIYVMGESLGTGVATYVSGAHPDLVSGLFLVAPYNNMASVAQNHLPIFPVRWMLRDKYPSSDFLKNYKNPLAILLAGKDEVIPPELGRKLYDSYKGPKKLWIEPQAGHNDVHRFRPAFWKEILNFWDNPEATSAPIL